jgi:hypothetical protein
MLFYSIYRVIKKAPARSSVAGAIVACRALCSPSVDPASNSAILMAHIFKTNRSDPITPFSRRNPNHHHSISNFSKCRSLVLISAMIAALSHRLSVVVLIVY